MSKDRNVIPIGTDSRRVARPVARPSHLPSLLQSIRDQAVVFYKSALAELYDQADDSLFVLADKAASNAEQGMFFEVMRALRLKRGELISSCAGGLIEKFDDLGRITPAAEEAPQPFAVDSLSLVQPDELEQSVALDGMVGRCNERNRLALQHLALRINSLSKQPVDEHSNPLSPAILAEVFVDSFAALDLDIKVRLILLKLFERYLCNRLDDLYGEANSLLIQAGILPDLKLGSVPQARSAAPRGQHARPPSGTVSDAFAGDTGARDQRDQEVLSVFSQLIGSWRHASGDTALSNPGVIGAEPMQSDELLELLAHLPAAPTQSDTRNLRKNVYQQLDNRRHATGKAQSLDRVDDDVISLVSMLFEFILDDEHLPTTVKALVARLQLPVLRVAIADKAFFSLSRHPARRLLNELARATVGWNDQDDLRRDQLYILLENMVGRLLIEPSPSAELFDELHAELSSFVRIEQRRSGRLEQRTRDAEEGKAKVEAARAQVADSLNALLLGRTVPVRLVATLRDTWSQVMQMTWLRQGAESEAWRGVVDTAERLIISMEGPAQGQTLPERDAANQKVLSEVAEGLELIGQDEQQSAPLLAALAALQKAASEALISPAEPIARPEEAAAPTDSTLIPAATQEALAVQPAALADIEAVHIAEQVIESVAVEEEAELVIDLPSAESISWVSRLHAGSWFELTPSEGQPAQRCKLAAIISFSGNHIFVNRSGVKVAEFRTQALQRHFDSGLIHLVDDNQLFDRALESVIGNLRQLQSGRS
ncbi:DUF1631 domain-containing protein [Pseudomonas sp. gcc21]|uniref:DUF1631 domain-containing protein n=1 Tax=Pseudomonas sp. gcc21 TaxID=2726989 RepID=UPI001451F274|nr:DUF1631 domain-containing protein [Pseudomonas sp. gcc21]QJD60640.1 DUF1631 domain-containing protein [Pseudomonas sp. gcc21]